MADEFDVIDIIHDTIKTGGEIDLVLYKDKAPMGEENNHVVISNLGCHPLDFINKVPVNVNIFIKPYGNGMVNRSRLKEYKRKVNSALKNITSPEGIYISSNVSFSTLLTSQKNGFDFINIRLEVIIQK